MSAIEKIRAQAPGALLPREWVLELLEADDNETAWLPAREASRITGRHDSTLRAAARGWFGMQHRGERPEIRVRRTGGGHYRYHEGDCWASRRALTVEASNQVDEPGNLVKHWEQRLTANL